MNFWLFILLLAVVVYFAQMLHTNSTYTTSPGRSLLEGFRPFSYLGENIKDGNSASWADRVNPYINKDQFTPYNQPMYVYQGSSAPLLHQMKPTTIPKDTMFYLANAKCSPECCPSPYSCDTGCVCMGPKNIYTCPTQKPYDKWISGPNSWQGDNVRGQRVPSSTPPF